jgi:hypothetical protein
LVLFIRLVFANTKQFILCLVSHVPTERLLARSFNLAMLMSLELLLMCADPSDALPVHIV